MAARCCDLLCVSLCVGLVGVTVWCYSLLLVVWLLLFCWLFAYGRVCELLVFFLLFVVGVDSYCSLLWCGVDCLWLCVVRGLLLVVCCCLLFVAGDVDACCGLLAVVCCSLIVKFCLWRVVCGLSVVVCCCSSTFACCIFVA